MKLYPDVLEITMLHISSNMHNGPPFPTITGVSEQFRCPLPWPGCETIKDFNSLPYIIAWLYVIGFVSVHFAHLQTLTSGSLS